MVGWLVGRFVGHVTTFYEQNCSDYVMTEDSLEKDVKRIEHGLFNEGLSFRIHLENPRKGATHSAIVNLFLWFSHQMKMSYFLLFTLQKETTGLFKTSAR
jgi:hypothetical protein